MRNEVNMYVHYNNSYICMNCLKLNEKKQPLEGLEPCIFGLNYVRLLPQECQQEGVQFSWL